MIIQFKKILFKEDFFNISLPDYWYQVDKTSNFYQYRTKKNDENLSISIFVPNPPIKTSEKVEMLDKFIDISIKNLFKNSEGTTELSDVTKDYSSYIGSFWGSQPEANHKSYFEITVTSRMVFVYHYESIDMELTIFLERARKVLSKIILL